MGESWGCLVWAGLLNAAVLIAPSIWARMMSAVATARTRELKWRNR
jgi:hypothetical protein